MLEYEWFTVTEHVLTISGFDDQTVAASILVKVNFRSLLMRSTRKFLVRGELVVGATYLLKKESF